MSATVRAADPFRAVHRANRRRAFAFAVAGGLAAAVLLATTWVVPAAVAGPGPAVVEALPAAPAAPGSAAGVGAATAAPPAPGGAPAQAALTIAAPPPGALPEPAPGPAVAPLPGDPAQHPPLSSAPDAPAPVASPLVHAIDIDTVGYQTELDRCLWVRMDLAGASAPIVGAHNNCGGEIVLDVRPGDLVDLAGQQLDGRYVAVNSRDGRPGQDAAEATAGFGATVILQTCYVEGPNVRLVALVRVV